TVACKFDKGDLGLIKKLYDDRLRTKDIFSVLNSIKMLFKTLYDDKNILGYTVLKAAYNTKRDQNGEFVQEIFWAYHNTFFEFMIAKDVLIIDAIYKINRFSMPLIVICSINKFGFIYSLAFAFVYSETVDFTAR
ncbi:1170_t:CDS:2, partial [Racocetra persica]